MHIVLSVLLFTFLAPPASTGIIQKDFTGVGNIYVLQSEDWRYADPIKDKVGCLDGSGKLIAANDEAVCGTFTRRDEFPYTLSTEQGNCTFNDESQERNTDSKYGAGDHAWNCNATYQSVIYDQLYTIVSRSNPESSVCLAYDVPGRLSLRVSMLW